MSQDFLADYLKFVQNTESPTIYHRWSALASISALLGRKFHIAHGHFTVYPNLYVMLIGSPGTRKSTAIGIAEKLLMRAGYSTFAGDRTSKEKFLLDLKEGFEYSERETEKDEDTIDAFFDSELDLTETGMEKPAEVFVVADEFNDFLGDGNIDFIRLLGKLWDNKLHYKYRLKNSKSIKINAPTISILGGNTQQGFADAFPVALIGQGFLSRLIPIYGESTGVKITFPEPPSEDKLDELVNKLHIIRTEIKGEATFGEGSRNILDAVYKSWIDLDDSRFRHYSTRRFTHLLKLCIIVAACHYTTEVRKEHVIYANTILTYAENLFPKAFGEYGKSKFSDVSSKIMELLYQADTPLETKTLWKHCMQDLDKMADLVTIMQGLLQADKIQHVKKGYLPKHAGHKNNKFVDFSLLVEAQPPSFAVRIGR